MATIAELAVKIGADSSELRRELSASERQLKKTFGPEAMNVSRNLVAGMGLVAAALGGVGVAAVKMAADMEQNKIAFTTMLGSAAAAEKMLGDLATFAEKTPFEFTGLVNSTRQLLAYGYSAQEVIPMLTKIGDAAAAFGATGEAVDRIVVAFGQMKAKGFISGEEMRQLASAGLPAWQMLAKAIGTDIPTAMKKAEDKAIDAEAAMAGMLDQMGQKYGGMMEKQSQTITGIISNIKDKSGAVMRAMGEDIVEALDLKTKLKGALTFLDEFADKVKSSGVKDAFFDMLPPGMEVAIYGIAGALTFAMIPALKAATIAAAKLVLALGPIAWIGAAVGIALSQLRDVAPQARSEMDDLAMSMVLIGDEAERAAGKVTALNMALLAKRNSVTDTGDFALALPENPVDKSLAGAMPSGGGKGKDPVKEAERVSDAIEREWVQTTKTQLEQLEIWKQNQLADLEKTAAANENYERDKERVAATYATRRTKILQTEAQDALNLQEKIKTGYDNLQTAIKGFDLTGSAKLFADMENEQKSRIKSVTDYYKGIQAEFTGADDAKKARILANLDEAGVKYKVTEQGNLDFAKSIAEQELIIKQQTKAKEAELWQTAADVRANIDAAYQANSMAMLQAALTEENAIRLNDYAAQQSMMQTWQQAMLQAHATTAQLTANLYQSGLDGLSSSLSDIFTMTKSVGEAFGDLGKAMLKTIADFYAKQIAGQMMVAVFGKTNLTTMTAAGITAGKAMAAAWAPAAAAVSLATFGANSAPAMMGIGATYALTQGLSFMASGGLVTGPSLAVIGEGVDDEAVLPLTERVFAKLAAGINAQGGGGGATVTQHVYGDINTDADYDRIFNDLGAAVEFAFMGG